MLPSRWRGSCGSVLELLRIRTPTPRFHPWTIRDHLYEEAAMDPVSLSRLQFAVTTIYHFFFVPLTIGLGPLVAVMHTLYFRTGKEVYKRATKFWGTLFLINFAMGVVTGIVQEFQFGLNWVGYALRTSRAEMTDFVALITTPNVQLQFPHVVSGGICTGAFFVLGVSAYHLWRKRDDLELFQKSFRVGAVAAIVGTFLV